MTSHKFRQFFISLPIVVTLCITKTFVRSSQNPCPKTVPSFMDDPFRSVPANRGPFLCHLAEVRPSPSSTTIVQILLLHPHRVWITSKSLVCSVSIFYCKRITIRTHIFRKNNLATLQTSTLNLNRTQAQTFLIITAFN